MGTLFIRYPGLAIKTRAQGGQFRILRCTFSEAKKREMLGNRHHPSLAMMQTLMNIRNDTIRAVMRTPGMLKGVRYRAVGAASLLRRNLAIYGLGGVIVPFVGIKAIDMLIAAAGFA